MVGKTIVGRGFGGCIRYLLGRDRASIIDADGLNTQDTQTIIRDFNIQRTMNPNLGKAVGHCILSWSNKDKAKLTPHIMAERAREYMKLMGIDNTQYMIVQHTDKEHPHAHIVFNRVDNNGKTISDNNNYAANVKACKEITLKYGYHMGEGKEKVNRENLRGKEKVRHEIYDAVKKAIKAVVTWDKFKEALKQQGIEIQFKYKGKTKDVQGISFSKGEVKFKGSAIDKSCSYSKLNQVIESNGLNQPKEKSLAQMIRERLEEGKMAEPAQIIEKPNQIKRDYFPPAWFDLVQDIGVAIADDVDDEQQHQRKRNRSRGR